MNPPGGWLHMLAVQLGVEPWRALVSVVSAVGIYCVFLVLVRLFGVRVLSSWNGFDAVVIIMFSAVAGRVIVGNPPTLATGAIGLATLMLLELLFGSIQSATGIRQINNRPVVLMAHGEFFPRNLRRTHLNRSEVYGALRKAGIAHVNQVQCVILEATGGLSILREGQEIDPQLLNGVVDADKV